jgi:hypothetical protein
MLDFAFLGAIVVPLLLTVYGRGVIEYQKNLKFIEPTLGLR